MRQLQQKTSPSAVAGADDQHENASLRSLGLQNPWKSKFSPVDLPICTYAGESGARWRALALPRESTTGTEQSSGADKWPSTERHRVIYGIKNL